MSIKFIRFDVRDKKIIFEQVENSKSRKYRGTGLGLSLCKNFVDLHGGNIWVDSKGPGHGSSFNFVIPRV